MPILLFVAVILILQGESQSSEITYESLLNNIQKAGQLLKNFFREFREVRGMGDWGDKITGICLI